MLVLYRNLTPGEVRTCKLSGKMIVYGDYYYQDTEDSSLYIKATEYHKLEKERKEQTFDYTLLAQAQNEKEYREYLSRAEKEYLTETILDNPVIKNGQIQNSDK